MSDFIEFIDGFSNTVVAKVPFDQVPAVNREVYYRQGERVTSRQEADEVVPLARVVRLPVDRHGRTVAPEQAAQFYMREYDRQGRLRRETLLGPAP